MARTHDNRLPSGQGHGAAASPEAGRHADGATERQARGPTVCIIRNPRSHRNRTASFDPPAGVEVIEPLQRGDTPRALAHARAAGTDCLIIDGGDGTVRDVLTAGLPVFGDNWPAIGVLPRGKTNALAVDLGIPSGWSWRDIAEHAEQGRTVTRRPLVLTQRGTHAPPMAGFLVGAGSFAAGIEAAQDAHRWGMFGEVAVGATVAWALVQMVLGSSNNRWRRGQEMALTFLPGGETLPYRGGGSPDRRSLLLATTLQRLPLGLKPWGAARAGMKLMVVDRARRGVFALAPFVMAGRPPEWLRRNGLHLMDIAGLEATFADRFILDGEFLAPGTWRIEQGPALRFIAP